PSPYRLEGPWGLAVALDERGQVGLRERDLASLVRAKATIFAGIRSLATALGDGAARLDRVIVSGNFGRYLNLPAAIGIGLLPELPFGQYSYVDNGSLEGAALALLSREFLSEVSAYLERITYVDLSDLPGYMDEFVGASFLPHTDPALLRI
ncbi:MAG: ASKHA domain-containing protein, partial [Acidobacteriota bacterium]